MDVKSHMVEKKKKKTIKREAAEKMLKTSDVPKEEVPQKKKRSVSEVRQAMYGKDK